MDGFEWEEIFRLAEVALGATARGVELTGKAVVDDKSGVEVTKGAEEELELTLSMIFDKLANSDELLTAVGSDFESFLIRNDGWVEFGAR